jgi:hypothetical protein
VISRLKVLIVVLMMAGCGVIPQPFRHEGKADPLARPELETTEADPPSVELKRVTVRLNGFSGFPGDGNQSLRTALKGALERRGLLVVGEGGDLVVTPILQIDQTSKESLSLSLTWKVDDVSGKSLGKAQQKGNIASEQANSSWGRLAKEIAEGGADGIAQVVQSAFTKGRTD